MYMYTTYTCVSNGDPLVLKPWKPKSQEAYTRKTTTKLKGPLKVGRGPLVTTLTSALYSYAEHQPPKTQAAGYTHTTMYLVLIQVHCWVAK